MSQYRNISHDTSTQFFNVFCKAFTGSNTNDMNNVIKADELDASTNIGILSKRIWIENCLEK